MIDEKDRKGAYGFAFPSLEWGIEAIKRGGGGGLSVFTIIFTYFCCFGIRKKISCAHISIEVACVTDQTLAMHFYLMFSL